VRREVSIANELDKSSAQLVSWLADAGLSPSTATANDEQVVRLPGALGELPEVQLKRLELQHWHGWPLARIAE
jgi:hypothetical protein